MQQFVSFYIGSIIGSVIGSVIGVVFCYITFIFIDWLKIRKYQKKDKK